MLSDHATHTTTQARAAADDPAGSILGRLSGRSVRCYHCGDWFRTAARAETASCTHCYRQVHVQDLNVKDSTWTTTVMSCGRITIHRKGIVRAKLIVACHGIRILGRAEGQVFCGGPVVLGKEAIFRGSINAPSIEIESGALLDGGPFTIPDQPIGRVDFPRGGSGRVLAAAALAASA